MGDFVNMIDPVTGDTRAVPADRVAVARRSGWVPESADQAGQRLADEVRREQNESSGGAAVAAVAALARGGTLGISDIGLRAAGAGEQFARLREDQAAISFGGELIGGLATGKAPLPAGLASRAGAAIAKTAEGAGAATKLARAAGGAATEGVIMGAGSGVSELALSKDPVTLERAISTIGSSALFGGAVGGGTGLLAKGATIGLGRLQGKLDDIAARGAAGGDDAAKVALREEVSAFRAEAKQWRPWDAAEKTGIKEIASVRARMMRADKALDKLLDDPKALVANPQNALRHLRIQEAALQDIANKSDEIRTALAAQNSTRRMAALDKVMPSIEKNRALQVKIETLTAKPAQGGLGGMADNVIGGSAFGIGASIGGAIPLVGPVAAPVLGGLASKLATGGLDKISAQVAARASKAIGTFLDVAAKAPPIAPVLASKVLSSVRFAPSESKRAEKKPTAKAKATSAPRIAADYKARTDEIKSQTQYDATGAVVMRPDARAKMAASFDHVRAADPIWADRMETLAARRLEFLAKRIPRKPDVMGLSLGPDKWQPSDMQMRAFARYVAAVEDPIGVVERLATGQITPEDAEAMREVYPELFADIQRQIMEQLPTLRQTLPYQRRLALSIFSGIPVDPALDPRILSVLQRSFADEPGSEGGTQAPTPEPAFGSVRNQEATPAQERQGATV